MKKGFVLGCCLMVFSVQAQGQKKDSLKAVMADEVVISANRVEEAKSRIAQFIHVVKGEEIRQLNAQNTGDVLAATGMIMVQKSQQGGGSPILRGFEASRVLLVVDGVRLNNLIYRTGHLQNIITLDNNSLERVEILFGAASTMYGSDALGGVVHVMTRKPTFATSGNALVAGDGMVRYSSANQEKTASARFNLATRKFAALTSLTASNFGDLKQGGRAHARYPSFGLRTQYVKRENGKDILVQNENPLLQVGSGYQQLDALQRFAWMPSKRVLHELNLQYSNSTDVPRYDRLTDGDGKGGLRFAEWYYGPQTRAMAGYEGSYFKLGGLDVLHWQLTYQKIQESRYQRRFGAIGLQARIEDVWVGSYRLDGRKTKGIHDFRFGIDGQRDGLVSTAYNRNLVTGIETALDTRYPDGDNRMAHDAVFVSYTGAIHPHFLMTAGGRYYHYRLSASFINKQFFNFPFNEVMQAHRNLSGSLGLIWQLHPQFRLASTFATGFRAPNIDDLAKVFESATGKLIVPNPNLKPERTASFDINLLAKFGDWGQFEWVGYYTRIQDVIAVDKTTFNGQSSLLYNGVQSQIYASQNKDRGYIRGVSAHFSAFLRPHWTLKAAGAYTYGRIQGAGTEIPLDHISPTTFRASVRYKRDSWSVEGYSDYNGWKRLADYNPNGEDNLQYATPDGMPAWYTLNVLGRYQASKKIWLEGGITNLFDQNYRVFASGISGAGRNLFVSVKTNW